MVMPSLELFDAVRIISLPNGQQEQRPYYSETRAQRVRIGDVGTVIGKWSQNRYRVEAVNTAGAIVWQDHLTRDQLEIMPPTTAVYSRRRINEHWAAQLSLGSELLSDEHRRTALKFARKVLAFAAGNIELLRERLTESGYRFANERPFVSPEKNVGDNLEELARRGVHLPIALQAWLMEVGCVDLCGTHPDWPRSGYVGLCDSSSKALWYTDPLVIAVSTEHLLKRSVNSAHATEDSCLWIDIAPDDVHKANESGGAPIMIDGSCPGFDKVLVGQSGSLTLLSYLRQAFAWGGFPGFEYLANPPMKMIGLLTEGLTRL